MKKIITLCLLLSFFSSAHAGLTIAEMSISPVAGTNDINVYVKSSYNNVHTFRSSNYTVNNDIITVQLCYNLSGFTAPSFIETDTVIPNINLGIQNYTIVVNLYAYNYTTTVCDYSIIYDTRSISFTTPLTETILETASHNSEKPFTIFPNPVQETLYFSTSQVVDYATVYDTLGRTVIAQNQPGTNIPVSELAPGNYIIKIKENNKTITQKFVKK